MAFETAPGEKLEAYAATAAALGARVSITTLAEEERVAKQAVDAAFAEIERVEELMSIYRPESQLSRLNREGTLDEPHPYFLEVLRTAEQMSKRTVGAFDVTVQPLWAVYSEAKRAGRMADDDLVQAAREKVDWRRVEITPRRISLRGSGTLITLNGIAQGYATDRALAAQRALGIAHTLIDAGELASLGHKADGAPWTVGIQDPRREDAYLALAELSGRFLATSGDYATRFTDDFLQHHLFDPRTGRSPTEFSSVSILAPSGIQADALSTAVFVLGFDHGMNLIHSTPGVDALLVLKDGRTFSTPGFPASA